MRANHRLLRLAFVFYCLNSCVYASPFLHGRTLSSRDSFVFADDSGCDAGQQTRLTGAYKDALQLASWASKTVTGAASDSLRHRYFSDEATVGSPALKSVGDVFYKISQWYPYWFFDGWRGRKIYLYCTDPENVCNDPRNKGAMGYARNTYSNGPRIFMCPNFFDPNTGLFGWPSLADRKKYLDSNPQFRKTIKYFSNAGQVILHEMVHLQVISGNPQIPDYRTEGGQPFYGPYKCERLAEINSVKSQARRNADNYAWYANALWFQYYYGTGDLPISTTGDTLSAPDDDYIDDQPFLIWESGSPYTDDEGSDNLGQPINTGPLGYPLVSADQEDYDTSLYDFTAPPGAGIESAAVVVSGQDLRILPLGDSITQGFQSSDSNGYRQDLVTLLSDNTVEMVGTLESGSGQNHEQGIDGATIAIIQAAVAPALNLRPNVVLLHAGTNDMHGNVDPTNAPSRLSGLIDQVQAACPDAVILVAQIIAINDQDADGLVEAYNEAVYDLVLARQMAGQHIIWVPMAHALSPAEYADTLHPNDSGYKIMASLWFKGIADAVDLQFISAPVPASGPTSGFKKCPNAPDWIPNGIIANGAGLGKNLYPEIVCIDLPDASTPQCACGNIDGSSIESVMTKTGSECSDMGYTLVTAVHFADINGDGLLDYLWVDAAGAVTAFINGGPKDPTQLLNLAEVMWYPAGVIATGIGAERQEVQFADLNGDGRAEYLWVHSDGSVEAWVNGGFTWKGSVGSGASSVGWLANGVIASGIGYPGSAITFADLNGDGRAEYLAVGSAGQVECYLNGPDAIDDGPNAAHRVWIAQGQIASGVGGIRNNTVFADIDGDGRADYNKVTRTGSGAVDWWYNQGGPDDGPNAAKISWWDRGIITGGDGSSGANVMLADLNGDGRSEYLEVDPDTSAVFAYFNGCPE